MSNKKGHTKIILEIFTDPILENRSPALRSKRTNWEKFRQDLEKIIDNSVPVLSPADIDRETELLVENIRSYASANTPVASNNIKPYAIPKNLLKLIRLKRKAKRISTNNFQKITQTTID